MSAYRVGLFTECYHPIQNGIVASLSTLASSLASDDREYVIVTPHVPSYFDDDARVHRVPSLPLPTRTAYRLTLPYLSQTLQSLSIVHAHSAFVTGWLALRAARRSGVPLVFTYHTQLEAYAHYAPLRADTTRALATRLTRAYANAADAVIVPTRAMEARLRGFGVRSRIDVIPTGIDCSRFARGVRRDDVRARCGARPGDRLILGVGRLGREKNVELALDAFAALDDPRARFVLVGDGTQRAALERRAGALGIGERVRFAGEFPRTALPDVYASADAFLFTSTSETQGLVLVEALASGVPIVAVDRPQTAEVLGPSVGLVDARPDALAAALRAVLGLRDARRELRRRDAWERFDGGRLAARVVDLYEDLAPSPARSRKVAHASPPPAAQRSAAG